MSFLQVPLLDGIESLGSFSNHLYGKMRSLGVAALALTTTSHTPPTSYHENAGVLQHVNPKIGTSGVTPNGNGGMVCHVIYKNKHHIGRKASQHITTDHTSDPIRLATLRHDTLDSPNTRKLHLTMSLQRSGLLHPWLSSHPSAGHLDGRERASCDRSWYG